MKVVLITGANRGIGKALVAGALEKGAQKVYAAVRRPETGQALVEEFGPKVAPIHLDLADAESIRRAAQLAQDVDLVINNGGVLELGGALHPEAIGALERQNEVNVYGLIRVAQAFAPILKKNGGGSLVQLNSVVSVKTFANAATYSASKAAAYAITQSLREELAPQGTRVISVHPGPIATDMANQAGFGEQAESPEQVVQEVYRAVQNGQFHVFPDSMARTFWDGYRNYAEAVIEGDAVSH